MTMMKTLEVSCCCGARMRVSAEWAGTIEVERKAFNDAHAGCRARPTLLWGGDQA